MLNKLYRYLKKIFNFNMGKKKLKKYRVSPNESLCLAVSVVDKPAVESEFIYLSEQKQENFVAVEKKERRMIYGCALRADFPIYRNNGVEEYYIEFDAESIDKISKDFMKNGFQQIWTVQHEEEVEGLTVTELWLKESPTLDKSIALGLDPDIPVGSLFMGCYCENDEVWEAVKNNKYHGFSIEALVSLEEFEKQMKDVDVEGSEAIKITPKEDVKLEEATQTVETPQEQPKVEEPTTTPPVEEKPLETPTEAENKPADTPQAEEQKPNDNHIEELIKNLQAEINALKDINKDLTHQVKDLSKVPSTKPVNTNAGNGNKGDSYDNWRQAVRQMFG